MQKFIGFSFVALVLSACAQAVSPSEEHMLPPVTDASPTITDTAPATDSTPPADAAPTTDATPDAAPALPPLSIRFETLRGTDISFGTQEAIFRVIVLHANVNLEIRRLPFTVARPEGGELARYAFTGSHGTPYLRDLKVFDLDRLVTVMGPADPSVMAMGGGVRENFMDSFDLRTMGMRAGDEVRLAITMDVALGEDARREFAGHHYTTYFGENGDRLVFHATDVRRIDDGTFVSPDEIEGNLDTSPTTVRIAEAANDHGCFSVDSPDAHLPDGIHCTAGCWYLNDGLPYTEQRDPSGDRCVQICAVGGYLIGGDMRANGNPGVCTN